MDLDDIDQLILRVLQEDGNLSNAEIARRVHLSPPATHARIRRLEEFGLIQKYVALLDRERIGYDMLCFIHLSLQRQQPEQVSVVRSAIQQMEEVLECYHVTGEYDYLIKVVVRNRKDLERFVVERLTPVPGIAHIQTSLVLSEVKSTTAIPVK